MPWKKYKVEGGYKVWKLGEDGEKVGNPLSDKPMTEADADQQVMALYANEKKPKKELDDVSSSTTSASTTNITGSTSTVVKMMDSYEMDEEMPMMMGGMPLTFADLDAEEMAHEAAEEMQECISNFQRLTSNIMMASGIDDKAAALADLAAEFATRIQKKATMEGEDKSLSIAKQIAGDNQPVKQHDNPGGDSGKQKDTQNLFIWKEGETYRWLAAYSNNRRDDDNPPEIISTESHKDFDRALQAKEWPMPELWVWHIPYPVGKTIYHAYDEASGFPIAGGVFNKGFEWVADGLSKAGWNGVSHGMPSEWIKRDELDPTVIIRHRTKEISILPQWAAANKLAFSIINKENDMADVEKGLPQHKRDELFAAFGEKAQEFEQAVQNTAKEADEAGIEKKETTTEETLTADSPIIKALGVLAESITALRQDFDTRLKALETKETEEKSAEPFDVMAFLQSKSAVSPASKVDGRSKEAKDGPEETKPQSPVSQHVGMPITLLDRLAESNAAYYNRGSN